MHQSVTALCLAALLAGAPFAAADHAADDTELCLDCHEPAEDWAGLSAEEIFATARDPGIKRHADNQELSDEALKALIGELTQQK